MSSLPHLMSPITVRGRTYPNRLVSAPALGMMIRPDGTFPPGQGAERAVSIARGGWGGVYIGETPIDMVWADRFFPGYGQKMEGADEIYTDFSDTYGPKKNAWRRIAREIHGAGSLAFDQLFHAGNMRICLGKYDERPVAIGPMGYTRKDGQVVKMMDEEDMAQVCASFARAAVYMKDAGFDGVMVHAGHGWLLTQFLSERCNKRTDAYGGSIEKRCKFPVMVMRAIRDAVGGDFIIECRVSGEETGVPGGYKVEQVGVFAQLCEGIVDIMHISNGHYNFHYSSRVAGSDMYDGHFCNLEQAVYVKERTKNMLVNVVGGITDPEESDRLIGEGKVDFVSMAKQIEADPSFGNKCRAGRAEDIQRCALCLYCSAGGQDRENWEVTPPPLGMPVETDKDGKETRRRPRESFCTVNPERGLTPPEGGWPEVTAARKLLVIGGGVAGMTAAITAADRGHFVTLAEKTGQLGGAVNFADHSRYKKDLSAYKELLKRRMAERPIRVLYNTVPDASLIEAEKPDLIVAAVGASPAAPELKGIENAADTAERVTVVRLSAADGAPVPAVKKKMDALGIVFQEGETVTEVLPNGVLTDKGFVEADLVAHCSALVPNSETVEEIRQLACGVPVKEAGDCLRAADVAHAIRQGYVAAMELA